MPTKPPTKTMSLTTTFRRQLLPKNNRITNPIAVESARRNRGVHNYVPPNRKSENFVADVDDLLQCSYRLTKGIYSSPHWNVNCHHYFQGYSEYVASHTLAWTKYLTQRIQSPAQPANPVEYRRESAVVTPEEQQETACSEDTFAHMRMDDDGAYCWDANRHLLSSPNGFIEEGVKTDRIQEIWETILNGAEPLGI